MIDGEEPAALSDGEYVVKADSAQRVYGPRTLDDVNAGKAEIIPADTLTEIGRKELRTLVMAMAGKVRRPPPPVMIAQGA